MDKIFTRFTNWDGPSGLGAHVPDQNGKTSVIIPEDGGIPDNCNPNHIVSDNAVYRLARYEDIGHYPHEIEEMLKHYEELKNKYNVVLGLYEKYMDLGDFERLKMLADADRQGRIMILPGKDEPENPCNACEVGWGYATTGKVVTCHDTCTRLKNYVDDMRKFIGGE